MTKGHGSRWALAVVIVLLGVPSAARPQEKSAKPAPASGAPAARGATPSPKDEDAIPSNVVEEMKRYTAPGHPHHELERFSGKWTTSTRVWEAPDAKPLEFPGSAEYRTILGGRFLQLESRSTVNGKENRGFGIYGYDAFKEKYSFYHIHDGDTQALVGLGDRDSTGAITFSITMDMPSLGERARPIRAVLRRASANRHSFEMYEKYLDDREFKVVEITFDRAR